jgi:tetratricopeptide (TPR) repeat protein
MEDSVGEPIAFTYRAFLSYSHRDAAWGRWLHGALEGYHISSDLVGRATPAGPVPKRLRPIFRDRDDFAAGHSLTEQTLAALEVSQHLIVICSPSAAQSQYVNEEVRRFKALGRHHRVIAIIVDGEPGDAERECFPPALRFKVTSAGEVTGEHEKPIAADARPQADGRHIALLKVVAGLIAVPFDEVRKREAIADSRRIKIFAAGAAVLAVVALVAGYFFFEHRHQLALEETRERQTAAREAEHTKQLADMKGLVEKLIGISQAQAAPGTDKAIGNAVAAAFEGAAGGDDRLKRAVNLLHAGKVVEAESLFRAVAEENAARIKRDSKDAAAAFRHLGAIAVLADPTRAREAYGRALQLDSDDMESLYWHGTLSLWAEDLNAAEQSLKTLLRIATAAGDRRGLFRAHLRLGEILAARGNLLGALGEEGTALAVAQEESRSRPNDPEWQRDLSVSHEKVGDVLVAQGDLPEALKSYLSDQAIMERLTRADSTNTAWQLDLGISNERIGDIQMAQGDLAAAFTSYTAKRDIIARLATADSSNLTWQRDLLVSHTKVGLVLRAQGNLPEALKSSRDAIAVAQRLTKADPANARWRRDLSASYNYVGMVLEAQGNLLEALQAYRDSHGVVKQLTQANSGHAGWQRDLSVSYNNIGNMLQALGNLPEALQFYGDGLAVRERLVQIAPGNLGWQRDLAVSHEKIGGVYAAQHNVNEARSAFERALEIYTMLLAKYPDDPLLLVSSTDIKRRCKS